MANTYFAPGFDTSSTSVPTGTVMAFAGSSAPTGYLLCDGSNQNRTTFSVLFSVLSTTYGVGDGSTTFGIPDLRGRAPVGQDNMGGSTAGRITSGGSGITGTTLGASGGAETVTLSTTQIPSHSHAVMGGTSSVANGINSAGNQGFQGIASASGLAYQTVQLNGGQNLVQVTGGGGAHNNTQPTLILNYIIKT